MAPALLIAPLFLGVVIVHELGHVLAAAASGATVLGFGVARCWIVRRRHGIRIRWHAAMRGTAGMAFAVPTTRRDIARQMILFASGGPLANLVCAAIALPLAWPFGGYPQGAWQASGLSFGLLSLVIGVVNLLPTGKHHVSDGSMIAAWWRSDPSLESSRRMLAAYDASLRDVLASEMPPGEIEALESDAGIGVRFLGHYLALRAAQQRGDRAGFAALLERCREELSGIDAPTYAALRSTWALFLVEESFERACAGIRSAPDVDPSLLRRVPLSLRLRLDAANALAVGDLSRFDRLLGKARTEAHGEFDAAARRAEAALHDRLAELRAEHASRHAGSGNARRRS